MKKLYCVAPKADARRLIRRLERLGCAEIKNADVGESIAEDKNKIARLEEALANANAAIDFLKEYHDDPGLSLEAPEVSLDDFESGLDIITEGEVAKANRLRCDIASLKGRIFDLKASISALQTWTDLEIELPVHTTQSSVITAGTFTGGVRLDSLTAELGDTPYSIIPMGENGEALVVSHKDFSERVRKAVFSAGFTPFTLTATRADGYARGKAEELAAELDAHQRKLASLTAAAKQQSEHIVEIKALADLTELRIEREKALGMTAETDRTRIICAWVPKIRLPEVEALMDELGCAYLAEDPAEGDDVPTLLSNNVYARQFEPIISMYSTPHYGEFDPTFIMSIFYTVIFGLMFADVGYGLLVVLGCIGLIKFTGFGRKMKKMLTMFALSGVSCVVFGVLLGGYFGDLPQAILKGYMGYETVKSPALIFDMIENPIAMLAVSLGVGLLHIVAAMLIKMYILVRAGDVFGAVFDVGSWLVVFAGIGVIFVNSTVGIIIASAGAAMLVLTQGRHQKNIVMKLVKGVMSLYDIISYASDLLSYSRILALALSSAVIATVVNLLATMTGFSFGGLIFFVIIFTLGHGINFALNLLSSYIHASRLQYLEFFGKFYEGGGRDFAPLSVKSNKVNLK